MSVETKQIKMALIEPNTGQVEGLPKNPRFIRDDRFEKLKKSIEDDPEMLDLREIIVYPHSGKYVIIGGNMRYRAMKELGFKSAPCKILPAETTPAKLRAITTKDNVAFGDFDMDALANEWDQTELDDFGLEIPGFGGTADFDGEDYTGSENAKEDDYIPPIGGRDTEIKTGDIIEIGPHRLICGDCTEPSTWEKLMIGELADMVLTDPPYNVDYVGKTKEALKIDNDAMSNDVFYQFLMDSFGAMALYAKSGAAWYIWHADSQGANFRLAMANSGVMVKQCLIWVKNSMVLGRQDYQWRHEPCLYGWKEGAAHSWYSDRKQTTVLNFDRPTRSTDHPTMKPIPLMAYQIGNSSKDGDIVADGFGGSGSTMVAAHQMNRRCRMVELDPRYCQVIVERMAKLDPEVPILKNGAEFEVKID